MAFLKPNCNEVVLFVIAEVFHKWKNANEKIFSDPVVKNSICGFHGYVTAKLKCWLSFKNLNEQMVSDTRKFHFSSSSIEDLLGTKDKGFGFTLFPWSLWSPSPSKQAPQKTFSKGGEVLKKQPIWSKMTWTAYSALT